jgi:hydroxymethylpyrimidine/phosphomethylpyrimidine kinase
MKTVLTIAGFDPSSGAGVTADLMVFAAHGLFGTACITALTVQSTTGVLSTHPISAELVSATLGCLDADLPPAGIKIGMMSNASNILRISDYCNIYKPQHASSEHPPVVLDPVLRSSSGRELLDPAGITALRESLLPLVDWITPNLDELSVLAGEPVACPEDVPDACISLQNQLAASANGRRLGIFATGGHLESPDDFLLTPEGEGVWLPGERVVTDATHGTGCALSGAFLCRLVLGDPPYAAAAAAKQYVAGALQTAIKHGSGASPINHLWKLSNPID